MQKFIKRRSVLRVIGGAAVSGGAGLLYASKVEPGWLDVTAHALHLPHLAPAFDGYRIVQISDIHADDTWMNAARLMEVVTLTNQQKPDLIVITGDYVTAMDKDTPIFNKNTLLTLATLRHLRARDGVLAVLGNHDHWTNAQMIRQILQENAVKELNNSVHTLRRGDALLHIVGSEDLWQNRLTPVSIHEKRLQEILTLLPFQGCAILLVHEPDYTDVAAATGRIDLQLSGHSHGGQVRIPLYGAPILPILGRKYPDGLYHIKTMWHYTSRGVGMVPVQVRVNCRPEIAVFTCRSS